MPEIKENAINLKLGVEAPKRSNKKLEDTDEAKGKPEKLKEVYLTEAARDATTMFIGVAGSGKSQFVIPLMFKQDLEKKDRGVTVICNQKDVAYTLYTMAKDAKRKVVLLKPSTNFAILNELLKKPAWSYTYINDNIINYKQAIKDKCIVIIDMEYDFYRNDAVRATAMLLLQLQTDMCITSETKKTKHYVYIDDCQHYLPFIEMLIECGGSYNVSSSLFFQGRNQFVFPEKDYTGFIDNNVRNTILMNNMNYEDVKYYAEKLCPESVGLKTNIYNYLRLSYGQFIYDIQGVNYQRSIGTANLLGIPEADMQKIKKKSIKHRKALTKIKDREYNEFLLQDEIKSLYKYENKRSNSKPEPEKKTEEKSVQVEPVQADVTISKAAEKAPQEPELTDSKVETTVVEEVVMNLEKVVETPENKPQRKPENTPESQLEILSFGEDLELEDFEIEENFVDDFDNVMGQLEGNDFDLGMDLEMELEPKSTEEVTNEDNEEIDIEMDEQIEITNRTKLVNNKANHIFFPTIVKSMQKQYNPQLKKVR